MIAGLWKGSLRDLTEDLYVNVNDVFPGEWTLDKSDPKNPVLVVRDSCLLPCSKDLLIHEGKPFRLGGLVVEAPVLQPIPGGDRVYIPRAAVKLIKRLTR